MHRIQVIDSHTGGEPTRVVVSGGPDLGGGSLASQRDRFRSHFDSFRSAVVNEPRGSEVMVGALLVPPHEAGCVAGVVFFNNVGMLAMCGHGTIGLAVTLAHLGRLPPGRHRLDTPVGVVGFEHHGDARVSVQNVPSFRHAAHVSLPVEGIGTVVGDVAWGGNWFFLTPCERVQTHDLLDYAQRVRHALITHAITGADGAVIDHIELTAPPRDPRNHGRNFVLCPGGAYDRSPCGTGTSAKLACLAADGKLQPSDVWRQESVTGSVFEATYQSHGAMILPTITGTAYITAEATLLLDPADPLKDGFRP